VEEKEFCKENKAGNSVINYMKNRREQLIEKKTTKLDSSLVDLKMRVVFNNTKKSNSKNSLRKKTYNIFESSSEEPMDEPPQYELRTSKHSQSKILNHKKGEMTLKNLYKKGNFSSF